MKKIINELIKDQKNNCIINLLKNASENTILPLRGNLKKNQIRSKKRKDDFVTDADQLVEEYLSHELKKILINSLVVGEESCSENPNLLKDFSKEILIWTCDPIDGTFNYVNMSPNFCSMVSLCQNEIPIACWLYFPIYNIEIISSVDDGLYIVKGENVVKVNREKSFSFLNINGSINLNYLFSNLKIKTLLNDYKYVSGLRCAGLEAVAISCGIINFIYHQNLTPWDHCPLSVLAKSTKNIVGLVPNCKEFKFNSNGKLLVADSKKNWDNLLIKI